tara:strand:+ start:9882 stop:10094 length:213 start_codon:yes stop_codon:yes gene_type:complete
MGNLTIGTPVKITGDIAKSNRKFVLSPFIGEVGKICDIAYSSQEGVVHQYGVELKSKFRLFLFPSELQQV